MNSIRGYAVVIDAFDFDLDSTAIDAVYTDLDLAILNLVYRHLTLDYVFGLYWSPGDSPDREIGMAWLVTEVGFGNVDDIELIRVEVKISECPLFIGIERVADETL